MHHGVIEHRGTILDLVQIVTLSLPAIGSNRCCSSLAKQWFSNATGSFLFLIIHPHHCGFTSSVKSVVTDQLIILANHDLGSKMRFIVKCPVMSSVCNSSKSNEVLICWNFPKTRNSLEGSSPSAEVQHIYSKALLGDWKISGLAKNMSSFSLKLVIPYNGSSMFFPN